MSNVKSTSVQGSQVETKTPIVLLDCGQASKVTKGVPWTPYSEGGWPPYDRQMM